MSQEFFSTVKAGSGKDTGAVAVEADEEDVTEAMLLTVITEPVVIGETIKTGAVNIDTDATTEAVVDRASTSPGYGTQPLFWYQTLASNLL